jgi:hypothetical protein
MWQRNSKNLPTGDLDAVLPTNQLVEWRGRKKTLDR